MPALKVIDENNGQLRDDTYVEKFISESGRNLGLLRTFDVHGYTLSILLHFSKPTTLKCFALDLFGEFLVKYQPVKVKQIFTIAFKDESLRRTLNFLNFTMKIDHHQFDEAIVEKIVLDHNGIYDRVSLFHKRSLENLVHSVVMDEWNVKWINALKLDLQNKVWSRALKDLLKSGENCQIIISDKVSMDVKLLHQALTDPAKFQQTWNELMTRGDYRALKPLMANYDILPLNRAFATESLLKLINEKKSNETELFKLLKITPKSLAENEMIQLDLRRLMDKHEGNWKIVIQCLKLGQGEALWQVCSEKFLSQRLIENSIKAEILNQMVKFISENKTVSYSMRNLWHLSQSYDWALEDSFLTLLIAVLDKSTNLGDGCKMQIEQIAKKAINSKESFIRSNGYKLNTTILKFTQINHINVNEAIMKLSKESDDMVKIEMLNFIIKIGKVENFGYLIEAFKYEVDSDVRLKLLEFWELQWIKNNGMDIMTPLSYAMDGYEVRFTEKLIFLLHKIQAHSEPAVKKLKLSDAEKVEEFMNKFSYLSVEDFRDVHQGLSSVCQDIICSVQPTNVIDAIDCF